MGKAIIFVAEHIKELVAAFLLFKIVMIAINAAIILNPIGWFLKRVFLFFKFYVL